MSDNVYSGVNAENNAECTDGTTTKETDCPWVLVAANVASDGTHRGTCDACGKRPMVGMADVFRHARGAVVVRCGRKLCDPRFRWIESQNLRAVARVAAGGTAEPAVAGRADGVAPWDDTDPEEVLGAGDSARSAARAGKTWPPPKSDDPGDSGMAPPRCNLDGVDPFGGPDLAILCASVANTLRIAEHARSLADLVTESQADIWGPRLVTVLERLERATVDSLTVVRCELNMVALDRLGRTPSGQ